MTTATLPDIERTRLIKILGLLSSEHPGEVANAGKLADNLLREHNLRWNDVIAPKPPTENPFREARRTREAEWRSKAERVAQSYRVTEWERNFAKDLLNWPADDLTERQQAYLDKAYAKCLTY